MSERQYLLDYVNKIGSRPKAADKLGIGYSTFASICNGTRGIGKATAQRMETNSGGKLKADKLIWIQADRAKAA